MESPALTEQETSSVVQNVVEIRRHNQLNQTLQLVIFHTGTSRLVDTLRDRESQDQHSIPISSSHHKGAMHLFIH